jgi:hypothetical protein
MIRFGGIPAWRVDGVTTGMEVLSRLSRSALLFLAGAVLVVAGVVNTLSLAGLSIQLDAWWQRAALVALGLLCLLAGWSLSRSEAGAIPAEPDGLPSADSFLFTLDDQRAGLSFPLVCEGAETISLLARTSVNIWSNYRNTVLQLLRSGVHLRVLIVDPASSAVNGIYGRRDSSIYLSNLRQMCVNLQQIAHELTADGVSADRLRLHLIGEAPPFSMLVVEKRDRGRSTINVQLSFLRTRISRDRPTFVVHFDDSWFGHFLDEFNVLWDRHSRRVTIAEFIDLVNRMGAPTA